MSRAVEPFDVCGPLPAGVTVLEASAGTGKTFTIAALAARYVADGVPLERLLVVTFTRAATGELRERVRERLVAAEHGLARALDGVAPPEDDAVVQLLAAGSTDEVAERRRRLAAALADFDAATITTTHGFCDHVLGGLGVVGDVDREVTFLEDPTDLVEEIVDDLYVRRFHGSTAARHVSRRAALEIAHLVAENPDARLEPERAHPDSEAAMRWRLATAVRAELDRRKRQAGLLTYTDQLTRLSETLEDPQQGAAATRRLRDRYRVVLVDEFQDTDPIQWRILEQAFGDGDATLVLIGDPKQAIYAFRGADVFAYLAAAGQARHRRTLGVNWRSDQGLLDAYDAAFGDAHLGHPDIPYRAARAAPAHQTARLAGAPVAAPLRVRVVRRADELVPLTKTGYASAPRTRELIAGDLAADVVGLLTSEASVATRHADGRDRDHEPVRPAHIGVLTGRNSDAVRVQQALADAGVPAVLGGVGSVFATPAATHWLRLLEALEQPTSPTRARLVALSPVMGWTAQQIADAGEAEWESAHLRLHRWAEVLRRDGVASLLETITVNERLPGRLLARPDGERLLADVRHVGELLHAAASGQSLGPTALAGWLRHQIAEADDTARSDEQSRRLESDAEAVQVLTIHRSKGLEFPVVYCPFLWHAWQMDDDVDPVFHDDDGRRTIDVGGRGTPDRPRRVERHRDETRGEELRLAYVALTRACHQAVVWWAPVWKSEESPLCRLLFCRDGEGSLERGRRRPPEDDEALRTLDAVAGRVPGRISVEGVTGGAGGVWQPPQREPAPLETAAFDRDLDRSWHRTSYTGIVAHAAEALAGTAPDALVASEPEETTIADEALGAPAAPAAVAPADGDEAQLRAVLSPLGDLPGGASVGTLVHAVLERTDFAADDLDAELAAALDEQRQRRHVDVGDPGAAVRGLRAAIDTPLGALTGGRPLRAFSRGDRLDELAFELALAGGEQPTGTVEPADVARLLRAHLPDDDPLAGYADRLDRAALRGALRGYLTGSIDLVLRGDGGDGGARFALFDYKTNRLGADGDPLTAWHYRPAALAEAVQRGHYPLQALLYLVALHRYLRWRVPGYDPAAQLAGAGFLFLRGMTGADAPTLDGRPCGVFTWQPPAALITDLSGLLDQGRAAA